MFPSRLALLAALMTTLMTGCAKKAPAPARISGLVTYNNRPIPGGTIIFHSTDLGSYPSTLGTDGTYQVTDLPAGELVVTVETESVNPKKAPPTYGGSKGAQMYLERMKAER